MENITVLHQVVFCMSNLPDSEDEGGMSNLLNNLGVLNCNLLSFTKVGL